MVPASISYKPLHRTLRTTRGAPTPTMSPTPRGNPPHIWAVKPARCLVFSRRMSSQAHHPTRRFAHLLCVSRNRPLA
jgi:hypothetical protein